MASYLERYFALLGDLDPIEVLQTTPGHVSAFLEGAVPDDVDRPWAAGKWSARQILAHLADVELAIGFRLRQTVATPGAALSAFDQDAWARPYARLDPSLAVEAFRALRAWNLALLAGLTLEDWLAEGFHPERGFESVDVMVRMLAGHDLNHLAQLGIEVAIARPDR